MADRIDDPRRIVALSRSGGWQAFTRRLWERSFDTLETYLNRQLSERKHAMSDASARATEPAPDTHTLTMERVFKAPRELVFEAFTDPQRFQVWWGPKGCNSVVKELDPRVGGAYSVDMHMPNGNVHKLSGTHLEVDPPQRLAYTWIWGQGDLAGLEMTVALDFVDHPDGTELRLTHSGLPSEDARRLHGEGWGSCLERLADLAGS